MNIFYKIFKLRNREEINQAKLRSASGWTRSPRYLVGMIEQVSEDPETTGVGWIRIMIL